MLSRSLEMVFPAFTEAIAVPDEQPRFAIVKGIDECVADLQVVTWGVTFDDVAREWDELRCVMCDSKQGETHIHIGSGYIVCSEGCAIRWVTEHPFGR